MYKIALFTLLSLPIFAGFFPQTVHTSVKAVKGNTITLKSKFPVNGMSGVIIHNYGSGLSAITSRMSQISSNGEASLINANIIDHDSLPTINTAVAAGDKVIGGYLYNNVLVLAPDANTYAKIVSSSNKRWIHPDLFAVYLSVLGDDRPNKENLAHFAKKFQIGLVYIVRRNTAVLFDPISGQIVGQKSMSGLPKEGNAPFFMRFKELDSGWFGSSEKGNYYNIVESI